MTDFVEPRRPLTRRAQALDTAALTALSPILVISPHADDETLGCGGLLAESSDRGLAPRVAYLTDGSASHLGWPAWPASRLAAVRKAEARAALAVLGVAPDHSLFMAWPDAAPYAATSSSYAKSLGELAAWAEAAQVRSIWVTSADDQHCDHQAANRLARSLCERLPIRPILFEYFVWSWRAGAMAERYADTLWTLACGHQCARRAEALACHQTQMGELIMGGGGSLTLRAGLVALTQRPFEIFVRTTPSANG